MSDDFLENMFREMKAMRENDPGVLISFTITSELAERYDAACEELGEKNPDRLLERFVEHVANQGPIKPTVPLRLVD